MNFNRVSSGVFSPTLLEQDLDSEDGNLDSKRGSEFLSDAAAAATGVMAQPNKTEDIEDGRIERMPDRDLFHTEKEIKYLYKKIIASELALLQYLKSYIQRNSDSPGISSTPRFP